MSKSSKKRPVETIAGPFFSVIVASYQRPTCHLDLTLSALARQNLPKEEFEVIVVDDGSEFPPQDLIDSSRESLNLTFLRQPRSGPAAARNNGASQAKGKFLAFTDDDCAPCGNWLSSLAKTFANSPTHMVGGRNLNAVTNNVFSTATQIHLDFLFEHFNRNLAKPRFFVSHNLAVPHQLFDAIGGFDQGFFLGGEDRDICYRWLGRGYQMSYDPNAVVYHYHGLSLSSFLIQHYNYGCGAFRFRYKIAQIDAKQIKFENLRFYLQCILYPCSARMGKDRFVFSTLLALSQIANAWGVLKCSKSSKTQLVNPSIW